eukprot:1161566-Pelagomonas_calceolata.AAC.3
MAPWSVPSWGQPGALFSPCMQTSIHSFTRRTLYSLQAEKHSYFFTCTQAMAPWWVPSWGQPSGSQTLWASRQVSCWKTLPTPSSCKRTRCLTISHPGVCTAYRCHEMPQATNWTPCKPQKDEIGTMYFATM